MKAMASRLVNSGSSFPRSLTSTLNKRLLSTAGSGDVEGSAARVKEPGEHRQQKLLVLGGNGYVGSHICRRALDEGLTVSSLSRSGRASLHDSWAERIVWHKGDLLQPDSLKNVFSGITSVISCVGGFGSNSHMYNINGSANIHAITAAAEQGVKRFVYISAADFGLVNKLLRGYYEGKRATETALRKKFPQSAIFSSERPYYFAPKWYAVPSWPYLGVTEPVAWVAGDGFFIDMIGVILRPGFIHGVRRVGKHNLNLSIIGAPLEMALQHARILTKIPLIGPLFIPPVNVASVAKVAVGAATHSDFPAGIVDVYAMKKISLEHA